MQGVIGRFARAILIAGLYLAGVAHWLVFFCTSAKSFALYRMNFSAVGWPLRYVYLSVLQEAIRNRTIPYHVSAPIQDTTRFLGIPDYVISPQVALLATLDIGTFVVVNTLLLYTIGFLGCLLIRRHYRLSLIAFTAMTFLLNSNGNVTANLGAGQYISGGFFLLPFLCLLTLRLVEGDRSLGISVKLALVLLGMTWQGSYHFYVWAVLFLLLLAVCQRDLRRPLLRTIGISLPLVAYPMLPAALTFAGASRPFLSGYPTLEDLAAALLVIRPHTTEPIGVLHNLAWFEYDMYIGVIGGAVLAYFGIWLRLKERPEAAPFRFAALDLPLLLMALLSLGIFFAPIASLPLPLFSAERVSSRFLIVPLLMLTVIAAIRMNRVLPVWTTRPVVKVLTIFSVLQLGVSLAVHSMTWRVSVLEATARNPFDLAQVDRYFNVVTRQDPLYIALVNSAVIITLASLLVVLAIWLRSARRVRQ